MSSQQMSECSLLQSSGLCPSQADHPILNCKDSTYTWQVCNKTQYVMSDILGTVYNKGLLSKDMLLFQRVKVLLPK